jgi:hypothetical protein
VVGTGKEAVHTAEAAALGFYYQTFFALLALFDRSTDDSTVAVEKLDDVVLEVNGQTLLYQLKHSIQEVPPPITLKSRSLWSALKVWIDVLPQLNLSEATLHLVTVATISVDSSLVSLTTPGADRGELLNDLLAEAASVMDARAVAKIDGISLPYADRVAGCEAFLSLTATERTNLLSRILIKQGSPGIEDIEEQLAERLIFVPPDQRIIVAARLIEWWDRQVVYSLCNKRERAIFFLEVQHQIVEIISDLERGILLADFETAAKPEEYQANGMLTRQIELVGGMPTDFTKAIREEWRAREQRSKWINEKPSMAAIIGEYDKVLKEEWSDIHCQVVESCQGAAEEKKRAQGLQVLRWTHEKAPSSVRPIFASWNAPYYVRGSYQVLAIDLEVGWHPDYRKLLGGDE